MFLAEEKSTQKTYAIKVLSKEYIIRKNQIKRTNQERTIMSQFNHPFMIAVKATFQTGVALFIVMEFIQVLIDLTIGWRFIPSSEQIWYIQRGESAVLFDRDIACVGISTQPEYYLCNF